MAMLLVLNFKSRQIIACCLYGIAARMFDSRVQDS